MEDHKSRGAHDALIDGRGIDGIQDEGSMIERLRNLRKYIYVQEGCDLK